MNEVSNTESVRAVTTNSSRKDAAAASHTATRGQVDGKNLPTEQRIEVARELRQKLAAGSEARERVERAAQSLNDYAQSFQRDIEFSVDEELGRPIVHVVDRNTQEVIRQIPSEVALRLARNLQLNQEVELQHSPDLRSDQFGASSAHRLGLVNTRV